MSHSKNKEMRNQMDQQTVSLTPADLQNMIAAAVATAIQESRKPLPPTDFELAQIQQKQDNRRKTAASVILEMENKKAHQRMCSHEHSRREGGGTHCVWVREENLASPGFILCQKCSGRIRAGEYDVEGSSFQRDRGAIYDTELFNRLFQECGETALMG